MEIITPKEIDLKIIKTTSYNIVEGHEIWVSGKIIAKIIRRKVTWHSKVTFLKAYEYVDEMLEGQFEKWRHLHKFSNIHEKNRDNR